MKTQPILATKNLTVGYVKKVVLSGLELSFYPGEFISLLGPNGVGKTTLLRTLSKHLNPMAGTISLHGEDLCAIPSGTLAETMSVVLTEKVVPPLFTVYDFVAMGRYPHTSWTGRLSEADDAVIMDAVTRVNARDLLFREMTELSDGERQKVLIARALTQEPEIILLDEPTAHLDLRHRMEVMAILKSLCREKGICVVASLHDIEVALRVSDRAALIRNHTVDAFGPPEEVIHDATISELYDFDQAVFSPTLGNIEVLSRPGREKVFVIGGMGSAAVLYRLLAKKGFAVSTGILLDNDIDCHVARSLGLDPIVQADPEAVSPQEMEAACKAMERCSYVIDAGFTPSALTRSNLELLEQARRAGRPVLQLAQGKGAAREPALPASHVFDTPTALVNGFMAELDSPAAIPA